MPDGACHMGLGPRGLGRLLLPAGGADGAEPWCGYLADEAGGLPPPVAPPCLSTSLDLGERLSETGLALGKALPFNGKAALTRRDMDLGATPSVDRQIEVHLATGRPGLGCRPLRTAFRHRGRPAPTDPSARSPGRRGRRGGLGRPIPSILRSRGCPSDYGPRTTVYNRFNSWSQRGFWRAMLADLARAGWSGEAAAIDSTYVKAHRSAQGGKGGPKRRLSARRVVARRPRSTPSAMSSAALASSC